MDHLPTVHLIARIYKTAVLLYGVLTLPPAASHPWAVTQPRVPGLGALDSIRVSKRDELNKLLRQSWGKAPYQTALCWPLVVAGVALVDGDPLDQTFVSECLFDIWMNPNTFASPLECRRKLLEFWRSGKTRWEDCFNEPVPSIG